MRYDSDFEQDSLETYDELSDAFETGLQADGAFETDTGEQEADTEALDSELSDFEHEFEQEQETEEVGGGRQGRGRGNSQLKVNQQRIALAKLRGAVQGMGRHIRKEGGRLRFKLAARNVADAAVKVKLDPRLVSALLKSLKKTNDRAPLRRRQAELDTEMDETMMWQEVSGACPGVTKLSTHWWGTSLYLNECHTKAVLEAAKIGGGAAAICTAVVAPEAITKTICAVAAGIITIGGAAIAGIDALGGNKGIVIRRPWVTPPGLPPVVIWHQ
jgi:hypothetical protein